MASLESDMESGESDFYSVTPPSARTNLLSLFEHFYHKDGTGFGPCALQMLAKALFIVLAGHIVKFLLTPDKTHPLLKGLLC